MARPALSACLELLKPITWFAPMWAYACGIVSSGLPAQDRWPAIIVGTLLAGPLVCGTSQAVNDWFDREVDALNEPGRPIPSGRIPGRWGLYIALGWTALSLLAATLLGPFGFGATALGLLLAWAYSAPPVRLKRNGWWGNSACGLCYESLPWVTGVTVITGAIPDWRVTLIALLYGIGAHGIMTLNDFKSISGDLRMGIGSLPARLGPERAARVACIVMAVPQALVIALLLAWGEPRHAAGVLLVLCAQLALMRRLLRDPRRHAPWYNGTGITLYVLGMLLSAFALRPLLGG
jgi:chlorophyll synthase